jgi:hypothetical protein
MRRKSEEPLQKVTLFLFEGDYDRIGVLSPRLKASKTIRIIVRDYINRVEQAEATKNDELFL